MHAFSGRSRHRKSDVVPLFNITPAPPDSNTGDSSSRHTPSGSDGGRRLSRIKPMSWSQRNVIPEDTASTMPSTLVTARKDAKDENGKPPMPVVPATTIPPIATATPSLSRPAKSARKLNLFAQSVISMNRQQQQPDKTKHTTKTSSGGWHETGDGDGRDDDGELANGHAAPSPSASSNNQSDGHDPWGHVLDKVLRKSTPVSKRVSLTQVLQRRGVKDLVTQAVVASHWTESTGGNRSSATPTNSTGGGASSAPRSSVMEHWMKTSVLRHANPLPQLHPNGDDSEFDDDELDRDARDGIKSGFDVRETAFGAMYGRTLLLEESCRRAFVQSGENRSQMDLQALKAWFQMTKLKITTDFERLQPAELDLLCRRMVLVHLHANEIVFRQGDEGDAMYIVFAGSVEVKVAQRVLGEKVEVTVCELSKGDYFGERALLHDDPRAATIVAKTVCELVKITRKDYTIMLKQDQQEFFSRMQLAGSVATSSVGSTTGSTTASSGGSTTNPSLILPRSRSTLHQQTQVEYVNVLSKKKNARTKADIDMLSEYLQTLKFFRGLPRAFVRELCTVIDFLTLPASTYVFREGDVGDLFYIIFSGSVDVIVSSKDFRGNAQQTKLINLAEGSHFGELALMKGHGIRSATVLTREETRFLVICEKDYNSTLRRMQKEDLAKRVGVLDRIPMFQTPEWTGELLKEMSYVLSEQKLATGSVLFRQGEKAQQVYFVVRGELSVTKEIVDPTTNQTNVAFVERIGRDRVVGDDAAAGANFNEVIYREVTITASTPVELLVLSKYDVFHRLSRSARETLRAAAQSHVESVVYLDRYHKTMKWDAYKAKLLQDHVNHERLRKLLPKASAASSRRQPTKKRSKTPRDTQPGEPTKVMDAAADTSTAMLSSVSRTAAGTETETETGTGTGTGTMAATGGVVATIAERDAPPHDVRSIVTTQSQLVDANEFLLLAPVDAATEKCFSPHRRSLAHHVTSFNADAPPRLQSRETQLRSALHTERRRRREVLNEGNPLAYFDLDVVQAQQRQQQAEVRGRAASSRRLLLRKRPSAASAGRGAAAAAAAVAAAEDSVAAVTPAAISTATSAAAETAAANVLNQFFQDNFIFSHPATPVRRKPDNAKRLQLLHELEQRHGLRSTSDDDNDDDAKTLDGAAQFHGNGSPPGGKPLIRVDEARRFAESLCYGDTVVVEVMKTRDSDDASATGESPQFRIVRCAESLDHAKTELLFSTPLHPQQLHGSEDDRSDDEGARGGLAPPLFTVAKKKFALLPRATRPRVTEEALQRAVATKFLHPCTTGGTTTHSPTAATSVAASAASPSDVMASVFASFQRLALTPAEQRDRATSVATTVASRSSKLKSKGAPGKETSSSSSSSKLFAIVSIVLSKRELETAFCDEPLLCVHALLPTEAEAMDQALRMPPQPLKNALLCILPVGVWIHMEDAYDYCVQIEPDRRDKHPTTHVAMSSTTTTTTSVFLPMRRRTGSLAGAVGMVTLGPQSVATAVSKADWQVDKEKAHRLHQFVCTRMGLKPSSSTQDKDRRGGGIDSSTMTTGFTPRPTVTLEHKLATLQEYLDTTAQTPLGANKGNNNSNTNTSMLGKYRQMKRFGSILRLRVSATSSLAASVATLTNENGMGSGGTSSSGGGAS